MIEANLKAVRALIQTFEARYDRPAHAVTLLAVSKKQPVVSIEEALLAGQREFGESYLQEALPKIEALKQKDIIWHFIGPIQTNKTRRIAENFDWVHSVADLKTATRLHEQRPAHLAPLNICLQVNISQEPSKSGITPDSLLYLAEEVVKLSRLNLRGLMTIPAPDQPLALVRETFHALNKLFCSLKNANIPVDMLSMGMSEDMEAAIAEGSTCVRIGTAIFGTRL